jgi:hypothetical protein
MLRLVLSCCMASACVSIVSFQRCKKLLGVTSGSLCDWICARTCLLGRSSAAPKVAWSACSSVYGTCGGWSIENSYSFVLNRIQSDVEMTVVKT